ncbi:ATP-binding protein [Clostridium sp. MB40-C1]|uniref:sensor histidine kinase n=1 Tax=Clostridium sp. MB40-C1 TaxID=3070996 RepID=UPI0027E1213C|nr:ATP-binding protein [Clostridium sp. MB40-C1]WMJ79421.1 ATP-binding protein [Clostridium sp. MB40-C1]
MHIIKEFSTTFIELSAFMILWKKLSLKDEKTFLKSIIIILIGSFTMAATSSMKFYFNIILSYLIVIFLVSYFYHKKIISVFLEVCLILNIIMISQLIVIFSLKWLNLNKYLGVFLFNISTNSIILMLIIIGYFLIPDEITIKIIDSRIIYYFIVNFTIYILVLKIIWNYDKNIILNNILIIILVQAVLLILNLIFYYYVIKINEEKKVMMIQNTYNPIINNIIDEIRSKQHDFKNHLNTINGIIEVTDEKNLKYSLQEYIKSLNYSTKSIDDIIYVNNPILWAVIYSKLCEARKSNIKFSYCVNNDLKELKMNDYELSEMLSNLLDNAFEASDSDDKEVILNITKENNQNVIEIKNKGITMKSEYIHKIFKKGFSTKKGENRGYGLNNVKKIVEHNNGKIQLFFENNYTIFKILI